MKLEALEKISVQILEKHGVEPDVAAMVTDVLVDADARGRPGSVGEYGWGGAYHSTYWVDPAEELIVVYLTQLSPAGEIDDVATLRGVIYEWIAASDVR